MKLLSLMVLFFLVSCGGSNRETPDVNPSEQTVKIGAKESYVLDPSKSHNLLVKGDLTVEVVSMDSETTRFKMDGIIHTQLGKKELHLVQPVPTSIISTKFLEEFRRTGKWANKDFKLEYKGIDGTCERVLMYDMKGYEWIKVNGLLCLGTKNVPRLDTTIVLFGQQLKAVFLQKY